MPLKEDEIFNLYLQLDSSFVELNLLYELHGKDGKNTTEALALTVLSKMLASLDYSCDALASDTFCASCVYANMDSSRKAITRYLTIETEVPAYLKDAFEKHREVMQETCIKLNQAYQASVNSVCNRFHNPAFEKINDYIDNGNEEE